jgi:hypothetical protein
MVTDTSIKDTITDLYDNSGYSDKYGLHIWIVILLSFIVFLACSYYYVLNNLQPIKANWNEEKCNPVYMPFAGVIHDKKGDEFYTFTANNFTGCIQTILQKITDYAFLPFYYAMNVISNIFMAMISALGAIREMFDKIRESASSITSVVFDRIFNITAPILEMFINIKSIIAKFVGTIATVVYTLIASYLGLQSFFRLLLQLLTDILYALVAVIVALLILSWIPGVFPIAVGFGAVMTAMLIVMVIIQIFMRNVLRIHSSGFPSLPDMTQSFCFDANTVIKLDNGKEIPFSQLQIGDILQDGKTKVTGLLKVAINDSQMYNLDGILVTGKHKVKNDDDKWIYVKDHSNSKIVEDYKERFVYCIITNTKTIPIGNYTFLDWDEIDDVHFNSLCNNCPFLPVNATYHDIHTYMDAGIHENMTVPLLKLNISKKISDIQVGDVLMNGEKVIATVKIDSQNVKGVYEYLFEYGNEMISTNSIHIYKNRYGPILKCKSVQKRPEFLYHLITDKGVFTCNSIVIKDYNSYVETYL